MSAETPPGEWQEEWAVRHSQGTHPGPFTERQAREWLAADRARDVYRRHEARGQQQLLRRRVTPWEPVE